MQRVIVSYSDVRHIANVWQDAQAKCQLWCNGCVLSLICCSTVQEPNAKDYLFHQPFDALDQQAEKIQHQHLSKKELA